MSQPLVAQWRIFCPYTVSSVPHKAYAYCKIGYDAGTAKLSDRTLGDKAYAWTLGAERFADSLGGVFGVGTTFGTMLLEQKVGTAWIAQEAYTVASPSVAGTIQVCTQVTLTLRDDGYNKVKVVALDTNQVAPQKWNTAIGGDANLDGFIAGFTSTGGDANDPWRWMVSRSENFLHATPFVSVKVTLNAQLENARNL